MRPEHDNALALTMPIKAKPYQHQIDAFCFVCERFGLTGEGSPQGKKDQGHLPPVRQALPQGRKQGP